MAAKKKSAKRKTTRRNQAKRGEERLIPAWFWLVFGVVMGVGLSFYLIYFTDFMPKVPEGAGPRPAETAQIDSDDDLSDEVASDEPEWKPKFDFYTILPEMEVVIPDEEITQRTERSEAAQTQRGPYILQIGSFRSVTDAERMKAQLALLGIIAKVESVTVNDSTWHRVRVGPYQSVRDRDRVKRQLQDNNFEVMVLSVRS